MMSNVDIDKRRRELTKITRQKSTGKRYVSVTTSGSRILKRLSSTGGHAILIGRVMRQVDTDEVKRARERAKALSRINRGQDQLNIDKIDNDDECSECLEVHALYELPKKEDLSTIKSIAILQHIAQSMGLSIVGVAVALNPEDTEDDSNKEWSPHHVHVALQVRDYARNDFNTLGRFFVLSVISIPDVDAEGEGKAQSTLKQRIKAKMDRKTREANPGLAMEAFELSKQAIDLYEKGILTKLPVQETACKGEKSTSAVDAKAKSNSRRRVKNRMDMTASGSDSSDYYSKVLDKDDSNKIRLASAVLTQSEETALLDPFILSVPLPIVSLGALSPAIKNKDESKNRADNKKKGTHKAMPVTINEEEQWAPPLLGYDFEHSFPSPVELSKDEDLNDKALSHLYDVFSTLSENPHDAAKISRLRDVHLLEFISHVIDKRTMKDLCLGLKDGSLSLSVNIKMGFDMLISYCDAAVSAGASQRAGKKGKKGKAVKKRTHRRITNEMRARGITSDEVEEI